MGVCHGYLVPTRSSIGIKIWIMIRLHIRHILVAAQSVFKLMRVVPMLSIDVFCTSETAKHAERISGQFGLLKQSR